METCWGILQDVLLSCGGFSFVPVEEMCVCERERERERERFHKGHLRQETSSMN